MEQTVSVSKVVIIFTITIRQPFVLFVLCPAPVTGPLTGAKCLLTQWLYYLDIYYPVSTAVTALWAIIMELVSLSPAGLPAGCQVMSAE